jgi:hypothetical protein
LEKLFEEWKQYYLISIEKRFHRFLTEKSIFSNPKYINPFVHNAIYCDNSNIYTSVGKRIAFISGIFHDAAYPFSQLNIDDANSQNRVSEQFKEFLIDEIPLLENRFALNTYQLSVRSRCFFIDDFYDNLNFLKSQFSRIQDEYAEQKINSDNYEICKKNISDHGILTALNLIGIPIEARQAICFHNLINFHIELFTDPIAFFLVLCDEAQEWGRCLKDASKNVLIPLSEIKLEMNEEEFNVQIDFNDEDKCNKLEEIDFQIEKMLVEKYKNLSRLYISDDKYKSKISIQFVINYRKKEYRIYYKDGSWRKNFTSD